MMTKLCDVCRSIKLSPPTIQWQTVTPLLFDTEEPKGSSAQFYHHHSSFQILQESANSGCTLCGLLVGSLQNTEDALCPRPRRWDGIILAWYKASIESVYKCSFRQKLGIDISHLTRAILTNGISFMCLHIGVFVTVGGKFFPPTHFQVDSNFLSGWI